MDSDSGLNDNLNGVERPVSFDILETGDNADTINSNIAAILEQFRLVDATTILFNSPPQDYQGALEDTRTTLNELEKTTAESYGAQYFDFASVLCDEGDPSVAAFGQHPNGEGGAEVCKAFMSQFFPDVELDDEAQAVDAMAGFTDDGYQEEPYYEDGTGYDEDGINEE